MNKTSLLPVLLFTLGLFCPVVLASNVPDLINYQGKLTDAEGNALHGEFKLEFRLFDAPTGGTLVWGEKRTVIVVNGVFNVALGGAGEEAMEDAAVRDIRFAFGDADRYLETRILTGPGIGAEQTLAPRQQMASVPFALSALHGVPVGTVVPYFGVSAPSGWLICAGQALPRKGRYEQLFEVLGTSCGAPDDESFNLPDLRGQFLRGLDDPDGERPEFVAAGRDPDFSSRQAMAPGRNEDHQVGTVQNHEFFEHGHPGEFASKDHQHWTTVGIVGGGLHKTSDIFGSRVIRTSGHHHPIASNWYPPRPGFDFTQAASSPPRDEDKPVSVGVSGGAETRPINAACNFIIKY